MSTTAVEIGNSRTHRSSRAVRLLVALAAVTFGGGAGAWAQGSTFYFAIPQASYGFNTAGPRLFVAGSPGVSGFAQNGNAALFVPFTIPGSGIAVIDIPSTYRAQTFGTVANQGLMLGADGAVTASVLDPPNLNFQSNDLALLLPLSGLGTSYVVLSYPGSNGQGSHFAVVGTADATTVTITPAAATNDGHPAGTSFQVTLNTLDTIRFMAAGTGDLTGTVITASAPVGVLSGTSCAVVPAGSQWCDLLLEMMPPVAGWGDHFAFNRTKPRGTEPGDVLRVVAGFDGTTVSANINGTPRTFQLNRGQLAELGGSGTPAWLTGPSSLSSDKPVLVGTLITGQSTTGGTGVGDPSLFIVPPISQWLSRYRFEVPTETSTAGNIYLQVTVADAAKSTLRLDGAALSPAPSFVAVPATPYVTADVAIAEGSHQMSADQPFELLTYAYAPSGSYGSAASSALAEASGLLSLALRTTTPFVTASAPVAFVADIVNAGSGTVTGVGLDIAFPAALTLGASAPGVASTPVGCATRTTTLNPTAGATLFTVGTFSLTAGCRLTLTLAGIAPASFGAYRTAAGASSLDGGAAADAGSDGNQDVTVGPLGVLFIDGFESGGTLAWTAERSGI